MLSVSFLLSSSLVLSVDPASSIAEVPAAQIPSVESEAIFARELPQATSIHTQAITHVDASEMSEGVMDLRLELADGADQELRLEVNDSLFADDFKLIRDGETIHERPDAVPLRGYVAGDPDSWARITFLNGQPQGLVFADGELKELRMKEEQLTIAPSEFAMSALPTGTSFCGLTPDSPIAKEIAAFNSATKSTSSIGDLHSGEEQERLLDTCYEIDVALIQDHTYISRHGGEDGADNRTTAIYNEVQRVFQGAINVSIRLTGIESMPTPGSSNINPGGGIDINTLLMNLAAYKAGGTDPHATNAGLTQLMTNRYQAGASFTPVGLAFKGTTCVENMGYSAAVISDVGDLAWSVATHETGHNFNSPHDGDGADVCGGEPGTGFIMQPVAAPATEFSGCSKNVMNEHISEVLAGTNQFRQPNCYHPCHGCGNGIVEEGEECDDRNYDNNDDCRNDCTEPPPPPPPTTGEEDDSGDDGGGPDEGGADSDSDGGFGSSGGDGSDSSSSSGSGGADSGGSGSSGNGSDSSGGGDEEGGFGGEEDDDGGLSGGLDGGGFGGETSGETGGFGDSAGLGDGGSSGGCNSSNRNGGAPLFAFMSVLFIGMRRRLFG